MSFIKKHVALVAMIALVLAITGGIFAAAWTSALGTDSANFGNDFATVQADANIGDLLPSGTIYGGTSGNVTPQDPIFTVDPEDTYTGELWVTVYLANGGDLTGNFEHLNIEVACANATAGTTPQLLSLKNARVAFPVSSYPAAGFDLSVEGGSWYAYNDVSGDASLTLYCEVTPREPS